MGEVRVERACGYCARCRRPVAGLDAWAGLTRDALTPKGRRMVVLAGSKMSFDEAGVHLRELCGIRVSDQTIRRACDKSGAEAKAYLEEQAEALEDLAEAPGEAEWSTDGAKVNTTEGWREVRGLLVCKRERGEPAGVRRWKDRVLPEPTAKLAWAAIADAEVVGERLRAWADTLGWKRGEGVSVVADGAEWIWKQACKHLPEHEGCLDVFHVMERLHAVGRALHGEGEAARRWAERERALLFRHGARRYLTQHLSPQTREHRRKDPQGEAAQALTGLVKYLWRHRGRMGYRGRLERGQAIGSGQMEGMCKNTLNRRLRKNNPRWLPPSVDRMAALCCLHTSGQWDRFWQRGPHRRAA